MRIVLLAIRCQTVKPNELTSCWLHLWLQLVPEQRFEDGFFREDGRLHHTESFAASTDVFASELLSCVPCSETVYTGPSLRLYSRNDKTPFDFMITRTAKAYDDKGARDFNNDEFEPLRLRTNTKVRVCGAMNSMRPSTEGVVTVHYVIDEVVVGPHQPPGYEIDPGGNAERPHTRVVDATPAPCTGGCGHYVDVGACRVQ